MAKRHHAAVEVVQGNEKSPWEACRLGSRETPTAGPSDALVRLLCRPVNPSDVLFLQGLYRKWQPLHYLAVPGLEGMGVVEQIGENVSSVCVGQRVIPLGARPDQTGGGLWQEYVIVPAANLIPIPDTISDEVAAQFVVNPWSVIGMLRTLAAPKGEFILQTASSSVLGRMLIQYARHQGVKTINLVRRSDLLEELQALGADEVIDTSEGNVVEKVHKITGGKMAYGALECVGGELTQTVVECVRDGGSVLVYGLLAAPHAVVGIVDFILRGVKVEGFYMASWLSTLSPAEVQELVEHTMGLLLGKVISPLIGEKYKLHDFKEAIKKSLEPGRGGKALLISETNGSG